MTVHVHVLRGCAPAPLAHYLKALAVLRLVGEQADPTARGWWKDDVFHLATQLGEQELIEFFCTRYAPTPMLAPWNGGSGFYPSDNKTGYSAIKDSSSMRFKAYREALAEAERLIEGRGESPKGDAKNDLLARCFRSWSEESLTWLGAAVAPSDDGAGRYPALLGTGGNDGRLDFTNNFMQRLTELFEMPEGTPHTATRSLLSISLLRQPDRGLGDRPIGQFLPGAAGGANGTAGFDAKSLINTWDFVLMLEGALVLRVGALRRLDSSELVQGAAPFAMRGASEGYGSAAAGDDSARGEQWMPLWSRPSTRAEIAHLFAEGRLNGGGHAARRPLEAAKAIARLGVARGVTSFTRFGYLERNGQANLAVPLGTFRVTSRPEVRLLDEMDSWLSRLRWAADRKTAPASFERACRMIEGHALGVCQPMATKTNWETLVTALGEVESLLADRPRATNEAMLAPVPALSHAWFDALDDGSPEARLALAIASQRTPQRKGKKDELGPIRAHCVPLDLDARAPRFATSADGLRKDPRVVWTGRNLAADLTAVAVRRALEAKAHGAFPLVGAAFATLGDVAAFLEGRTDDTRIAALARGLMALDWSKPPKRDHHESSGRGRGLAVHAILRLAYLPSAVGSLLPHVDATALRLLSAGRLAEGVRAATTRLTAMGLRPKLRVVAGDAAFALRLAATAAIPVSLFDLHRLLDLAAKPFDIERVPPSADPRVGAFASATTENS